jgi:hypothetical protein
MQLTDFTMKLDNYNYCKVFNVYSYTHENFTSYTCNVINNSNTAIDYYLILDTVFSDAFFHWIAECVIFFPLFIELKKDFPTLKIICKTKQDYHTTIGNYFGIDSCDIIYKINNINNVCFFPKPISALNDTTIIDDYITYSRKMVKYFNKEVGIEKDIDVLLLPRQTQNNKNISGQRKYDYTDIINKIPNITIFNTDTVTNLNEQIQMISHAKTIIVTDGSPYLFNGLFSKNAKIIVLGNIVCSQINDYKKMKYYNDIINFNNTVIFIPYLHGDFNKNTFLFDDIAPHISCKYGNCKYK